MTYNLDLTEGLIPAHAGKTIRDRGRLGLRRAHPRSRGENHPGPGEARAAAGSSPLTRGKLPRDQNVAVRVRLIPAHAGKTRRRSPLAPGRAAHPRSRGENGTRNCFQMVRVGSSPLTRGKRFELEESREDTGLIPAHAGKTQRA